MGLLGYHWKYDGRFGVAVVTTCLFLGLSAAGLIYSSISDSATGDYRIFAIASSTAYGLMYFLPTIMLGLLVPVKWRKLSMYSPSSWAIAALLTLTELLLLGDMQLYQRYGFHINGFVINILMTPGGLESLGMTGGTSTTLIMLPLVAMSVNILLLTGLGSITHRSALARVILRPRHYLLVSILAWAGQALTFGYLSFYGVQPAYAIASAIPGFQPVSYRSALRRLGHSQPVVNTTKGATIKQGKLAYPLKPLRFELPARPPNIVWLVAESWRADTLNSEIMPNTSRFAADAIQFSRHYSGGNGTRMGMFSMFYGLYGSYWFDMLNHRREPVIFELLRKANYQMSLYTSAKFSYPEFDKTLFSGIDKNALHEDNDGFGWERDQRNVTQLLDFIAKRDTSRPFMTFMFFESPHASYYFPDDAVIEDNYLKEFNYLTTDVAANIEKIKGRYINAVHHLDMQLQRVYEALESTKLLENTIVIITGDHGEEFMEKGYWGHNSTFSQEQIRVPLILRYPGGTASHVGKVTNHIDIIPTLLPMLGVTSPGSDYSLGLNLLSDAEHDFMVLADWDSVAIVTPDFKQDIPLKAQGIVARTPTTTLDDKPLADFTRDSHYSGILWSAFNNANHFYH